MYLWLVATATIATLTGCGEDPIVAAAREARAKKGPGAGQAAPGGNPQPPPSPGGAGTPAGPGAGGTPAPGVPEQPKPGVPSQPPPGGAAGPSGVGAPGQPQPGVPNQPQPGVPEEPKPGLPGSPQPNQGPTVAITGTVDYPAWRTGSVRVDAFDGDHSAHGSKQPSVIASVRIDRIGAFSLLVPQGAGKVYVEAAVDEDGDGRPGPQDPQGVADRYPVTVGTETVSGLTIRLVKRPPPAGGGSASDF